MKKLYHLNIITIAILLLAILPLNTIAKTEVYFSLLDDPQSVIINNINKAGESINIAMYSFTEGEIAKAVVKAHNRGVAVKVYLDSRDISNEHSKSRFLINEGIEDIRISSGYSNHNKFAIIDNSIVITGSYNWTASAGSRNDENLLVIDDTYIVQRYHDYFYYLWDNKYSVKRYEELLRHPGIRLQEPVSESKQNHFLVYKNMLLRYMVTQAENLCEFLKGR